MMLPGGPQRRRRRPAPPPAARTPGTSAAPTGSGRADPCDAPDRAVGADPHDISGAPHGERQGPRRARRRGPRRGVLAQLDAGEAGGVAGCARAVLAQAGLARLSAGRASGVARAARPVGPGLTGRRVIVGSLQSTLSRTEGWRCVRWALLDGQAEGYRDGGRAPAVRHAARTDRQPGSAGRTSPSRSAGLLARPCPPRPAASSCAGEKGCSDGGIVVIARRPVRPVVTTSRRPVLLARRSNRMTT
jgi:hypothetical protein